VLRSLERRKEELEALDKEIRRREERVKAAERSLDVKISELKKIRAEILALVEKDKGQRDARLQSIVTSVCMNMKPESAAQVLTKMDTEQVLRMLPLVPEKQLSRIFEKMEPARAAQLSADYLKMKQNIPRLPEN
jgi:flagellar motility protein MotE (MotC chaperone)